MKSAPLVTFSPLRTGSARYHLFYVSPRSRAAGRMRPEGQLRRWLFLLEIFCCDLNAGGRRGVWATGQLHRCAAGTAGTRDGLTIHRRRQLDSAGRNCRRLLRFCIPNHLRPRLPLPGFHARCRTIFRLLRGVAEDEYAGPLRNVSVSILAPFLRAQPLQEKPEHLRVRVANGLDYGESVLIRQVGVKTFITERQEKLVVLVDHPAAPSKFHAASRILSWANSIAVWQCS